MFRKFAIAAVTIATVATTAVALTPSEAHARNNRAGAVAAGAILGLAAGAIIGSKVQPRYHAPVRCRNQPIRRWNAYYRQYVVVGYRQVCY
ncbi:tyrosyl-tRNA synthetase [Rhodobacterales bacterium]|nr:tyrosyl-tRNA synthetase [Rhodobacterales bacterium]